MSHPVVPRRSALAVTAVVLEVLLGLGALGGGAALMAGPHGELISLPLALLDGSPFHTYFGPGLILFSVLGVFPIIVAVLAWRRQKWAPALTLVVGAALSIWMAVEVATVGYSNEPPLQPIYLALGLVITLLGGVWALGSRPTASPRSVALAVIKTVHTLAWALFAGCIVAIPIVTWHRDHQAAGWLAAIVAFEVGVLLFNGLRCPLTAIAARYTDDRRDNFDIFLPAWLAKHNKTIFGALYIVGLVYALSSWLTDDGALALVGPLLVAGGLAALGVTYAFLTRGPSSHRAEFDREIARGLARPIVAPLITEADLAALPDPVQRYLRATGFVGQPRVRNYRVRFAGRIRSAADARWMPFIADQQSFVDEPTRLFLMRATMFGVPVQAFHRLVGGAATMRVKIAGAFTMVDARGPEMDRAETVTLFNDMCILAPGTLVESAITWESVDAHSACARFTNGATTIGATLMFDDEGLLTNFVSDDRLQVAAAGGPMTPQRFSTPVRDYRRFGAFRLAGLGEARWHAPAGVFTYIELEMLDVAFNLRGLGQQLPSSFA